MAVNNLNPAVVPPTAAEIAAAVAAPSAAAIASAVAAPSAAAIAAAVAAPSAATIASTVAAPSAATIASTVAGSVPTLTQINNSVATNAPSPNAWVHLGTGSLANVNSATVSFSAYRYLRIVYGLVANSGSNQQISIRFNGDSNGFYRQGFFNQLVGQPTSNSASMFLSGNRIQGQTSTNLNGQAIVGYCEVFAANLGNAKSFYSKTYNINSAGFPNIYEVDGFYAGGSAITSVTIFDPSGVTYQNNADCQFQVFGAN